MKYLIGTYTLNTASKGIYYCEWSGSKWHSSIAIETDNPSWLVRHPSLPLVYCVNELSTRNGSAGFISVLQISTGGRLELRKKIPSFGDDPCHLALNKSATCLVVSNYTSGTLVTYPLANDGIPGAMTSLVQHQGSGPDPMRQKTAHTHSAIVKQGFAYVADLGIDQLIAYPIDTSGTLNMFEQHRTRFRPGSGPRHMAVAERSRMLYVICELDNRIVSFERAGDGSLIELAETSALPPGYSDASYTAQILLSADERFLYASNRGHNSVAVFETKTDGKLQLVQHIHSGGRHPRHFCLSLDETTLLVANRDDNNVVPMARDVDSGRLVPLSAAEAILNLPAPVCILPMQ